MRLTFEQEEQLRNRLAWEEQQKAHQERDENTPCPTYADRITHTDYGGDCVRLCRPPSYDHRYSGWRVADIQYDGWNPENHC